MKLFILSFISGLLSYFSVSLPRFFDSQFGLSDDALFYLPGILFAVFILIPLIKTPHLRILRSVTLLALSIAAWYVAASIGIQVLPFFKKTAFLSIGISGSIGVLCLAIASKYLIPIRVKSSSLIIALWVGFLGGCILGLAIVQPRASLGGELLYLVGFIFWHCGVAFSLFWSRRITDKKTSFGDARREEDYR
jgi:hypothetical protein